jgi:TonB-dependent starch-binding outer membrane protein SusC
MKKVGNQPGFFGHPLILKFYRIIKISIVIILATCLQVSANGFSQNRIFENTTVSYELRADNLVVLKASGIEKQEVYVNGKVVSATGEPIAGVSVTVQGTTTGTSTNGEGAFSITVPEGATLVFSSVGFVTQQVTITPANTNVTVTLQASTSSMDEVVVVGYGTQRRQEVTGSVASVKGADIARQPVVNPALGIQGRVAGVQIISSGQPNANPIVRVRGTGSMLGGASPLYVVDGVITDDIRNINSADIVTMDILKDASATAIYGMRAANGVLIITTKKGRSGKMIVAYDGTVGVNEATDLVRMAGANQYTGYINEAAIYYDAGDSVVTADETAGGYNTNWYDAILRKAFQQNHNVSLSGGSEKINYFFSAGYITEQGIVRNNKFNRFTLRSNNEYKITNALKFSTLVSYSRSDLNNVNRDAFDQAYRAAPYVPSKVGDLYGNTSLSNNVGNPLVDLDKNYDRGLGNRLQGTIVGELKPLRWLTLRSGYGVDLNFFKNTIYGYVYENEGDANIFIPSGGNQLRDISTLEIVQNDVVKWVWDNTATATQSFGDHNFTLLVGTTSEKYTFNELRGKRFSVPENKSQWFLGAGSTVGATNDNTGDQWTRNSFIGRLNYNFNEKYFLTATMRADGTSRFEETNRWGYFPSVGVAWNIENEGFMENQETFSDLRLRASWGKVGNDQIPTTAYRSVAGLNVPYFFDGTRYLGIRLDELADENVRWEITEEYDLGVDFGFLNNRLNGQIDFYHKKTQDALVLVNVPGILGDPDNKYITNAASFENKGVELGLTWSDKVGSDWSYSVSGNIAYNRNKVLNLNGGEALFGGTVAGNTTTKSDNGQPIGSFFLREAIGIFQNYDEIEQSAQTSARPGDLIYRDISGPEGKPDGAIDDFDRQFFGSYQPKVTFGFNGNVNYLNFDLSIGTYGTAGGKIYNGKKNIRGSSPYDNIEAVEVENRWMPNNPNTNVPRANFGKLAASTYYLEKGDFFRINNLTVGYTLPKSVLTSIRVTNLRIYATVQNLATFTGYSGFTPELIPATNVQSPNADVKDQATNPGVLSAGIESNSYPTIRRWALGVNLSF